MIVLADPGRGATHLQPRHSRARAVCGPSWCAHAVCWGDVRGEDGRGGGGRGAWKDALPDGLEAHCQDGRRLSRALCGTTVLRKGNQLPHWLCGTTVLREGNQLPDWVRASRRGRQMDFDSQHTVSRCLWTRRKSCIPPTGLGMGAANPTPLRGLVAPSTVELSNEQIKGHSQPEIGECLCANDGWDGDSQAQAVRKEEHENATAAAIGLVG